MHRIGATADGVNRFEATHRNKHDRGLAGRPSRDHCSTAAEGFVRRSSARSKSPIKRISVAKLDVIRAVDILYLPPHLIGNLLFMSAFPPAFDLIMA